MIQALPVIKAMKELRSYSISTLTNIPRRFKYPVLDRYYTYMFTTMEHLHMLAHERKDDAKVPLIDSILCEFDIITDLVEFMVEIHAVSINQGAHLFRLIDEIGKQLGGLRKFLNGKSELQRYGSAGEQVLR